MAAVPGLQRALSPAERNALRAKIATKKAAQVAAENATRAAKDKKSVEDKSVAPKKRTYNTKQSTGSGRVIGRPEQYPKPKVKAGKDTVRVRTRTGSTVVGAPTSERQRAKSRADELAARAARRPSRAATPQSEKPKNSNYKAPSKGKKTNSSPGMGAPTGGTGRDQDGGQDRNQFEAERRKRMQGGKDRPPVYTPKDDGERGGYTNRSKPIPEVPGTKRQAPRKGGTIRTDSKPIIPAPQKKKIPNPGTSVVRGLMPR